MTKRLEVHEHSFIRGPRSRFAGLPQSRLVHSHEGGDRPHEHPDTGPAKYTIDKDEWYAATGLRGGGRKKFTAKPTGEQLPLIPREPESFRVIIHDPPCPPGYQGEGPGEALPLRIAKTFRMPFTVEQLPQRTRKAGAR